VLRVSRLYACAARVVPVMRDASACASSALLP
jgi:hypothetical protein